MNSSFCKVYVINNKISVATINCSRSSIVQQPSFCHKSRNPFSLDEGIAQWYMSELDITWCCFIHFTAVFYITIYELATPTLPSLCTTSGGSTVRSTRAINAQTAPQNANNPNMSNTTFFITILLSANLNGFEMKRCHEKSFIFVLAAKGYETKTRRGGPQRVLNANISEELTSRGRR